MEKTKKILLYIFAGIGALSLVFYLFLTGSLNPASRRVNAPAAVDSNFGLSGVLQTKEFSESKYSADAVVNEGQLTQRKIVKNGSLSLLVKKAEEAADKIRILAERSEGFVDSSNIYETSNGIKSGTIVIRVPAKVFDGVMEEIKKMAVKVEREIVNARDVTEQFIDLEARLNNLRAEEERYLEIMKQADSVQDTLNVAQRLSDVRGRIEQAQGQLQYLSRQIDMSSISISLIAEADVEVFGISWRPLFVIKQSLRNMFSGFKGYADLMINFIFLLPVIVLWLATAVIIAAIGWRILKLVKIKFFTPAS